MQVLLGSNAEQAKFRKVDACLQCTDGIAYTNLSEWLKKGQQVYMFFGPLHDVQYMCVYVHVSVRSIFVLHLHLFVGRELLFM